MMTVQSSAIFSAAEASRWIKDVKLEQYILHMFTLTIFQLWLDWTGLHLIRVGGGLLLIALAVTSVLVVASLLAVLWLVSSLGAGVGVLLTVACLAKGIGGRLLFL